MKKMNFWGLSALVLVFALTSCTKEDLESNVPDAPATPGIAEALVVNAILNQDLSNLTLKIGSTEFATGLDYKDLTDYLEVETGELLIDLLADDNTIIASTSYTFQDNQYYNIILVMDEDGINPTIEILGQSFNDFELSDTYASELGYTDGNLSVFAANAISYNVAYKDQNFLIDLDYEGAGFAFLDEYLALEYGAITDIFFGNDDLITDLDLAVSALELTDLLDDESGFVVVSETLLEDLGLANGGRYTILLLGDELNFDSIVINHIDAGLLPE
jgi:hypothetical protein